jgi:hypothetical protein
VEEVNRVVTPTLLADLGFFAPALGSAELLASGDYNFEAGLSYRTPINSEAIEVFPDATLGFTTAASGASCYRSFRMATLYTAPDKN